ncbi:hypothetical protein EWB00_004666 [Schistosoma japonicum]|uniref:Uncharacterized protein n=1 Tax=Schistosoma japonicum TaxID=6182 RepID=A0A4Z2DXY3_SCHJA|nr:hypothetical protein KSF78_0003321 [Schistosoma japonicum]KAH8866042.1 hypothetical protein KSF78_0003321 [Schistosoma japonicum]KAH8866045.1 hypothetical protein KSF78_0003321 [Schistosoma japonicum]TNN21415.1 hypothetical protein EWB00_004666 [Schistosoma japonicum]
MTDSNTELSSFHFESRRINNSTLCSKCAASILNQDLDCLHMDTELTRPYSRFKVKPIIKTRDGLLHSRRACYDIGNGDETSSEHLLSSICKSSDSSNSHSFTSYWDPSEKLSYESSLVFIRKSNANIVESNEQSSRSKKHEKFISDDIWKGHSSKDNQQEVQRSVDSFNEINPISESSESALQLSPYLIDDPVQRFHARHYDKLYQYMMFVHSYLPIPVAITVEKYTGSKITAYILSDNSDKYERNVLHHLQTDSAYCNSNNKSSKSLQKISSNLILHFACNKHYSQCLYPGPLQNKCFSVKTKHSVYWMQLLILEVQFNRSKPLYITHPSMQLLRNLWNELKSDILHNLTCNKSEISPSNICVIGKNRENKNVTSRPASICDTLTKRREVLTNQKLQMNSKLHSRNSLKIKSKIKTRRQLGFFFIATRSYPTSKHLDGLCKELKEIGYFELFQMEKIKSTERYPATVKWNCFVCENNNGVWENNLDVIGNITGTNRRQRNKFVQENAYNLDYKLNAFNPQFVGAVKIRHIKTVPRVLAWMISWEIQEFKLEDGYVAWRNCSKSKNKTICPSLPNSKAGCKMSNSKSSCKDISSERWHSLFKTRTEKGWFYLPVDEILRVKGKYRNGSQYLDHIEIKTCDRGTWLLKPHLNEYPSGLHKSNREKNLNKDCLINDHLELWLRGLQIAMVRSRRR